MKNDLPASIHLMLIYALGCDLCAFILADLELSIQRASSTANSGICVRHAIACCLSCRKSTTSERARVCANDDLRRFTLRNVTPPLPSCLSLSSYSDYSSPAACKHFKNSSAAFRGTSPTQGTPNCIANAWHTWRLVRQVLSRPIFEVVRNG